MDDDKKKLYELSERITAQGSNFEKGLALLESTLKNIDKRVNDDLKQELWDIKQSIKSISQIEKDIIQLAEQTKSNANLQESNRQLIEAKMVTKEDLENIQDKTQDKKYKSMGIKISIVAILISLLSSAAIGFFSYKKLEIIMNNMPDIKQEQSVIKNTGNTHVPSNHKE